jgi:hypothetical protein
VWLHVFAFLDARSLILCHSVCKMWHAVLWNYGDTIWRTCPLDLIPAKVGGIAASPLANAVDVVCLLKSSLKRSSARTKLACLFGKDPALKDRKPHFRLLRVLQIHNSAFTKATAKFISEAMTDLETLAICFPGRGKENLPNKFFKAVTFRHTTASLRFVHIDLLSCV